MWRTVTQHHGRSQHRVYSRLRRDHVSGNAEPPVLSWRCRGFCVEVFRWFASDHSIRTSASCTRASDGAGGLVTYSGSGLSCTVRVTRELPHKPSPYRESRRHPAPFSAYTVPQHHECSQHRRRPRFQKRATARTCPASHPGWCGLASPKQGLCAEPWGKCPGRLLPGGRHHLQTPNRPASKRAQLRQLVPSLLTGRRQPSTV